MNKKILILYASIGMGHKSIAENIGYYLEAAGYQVRLEDAQKVQGGFLVAWGTKLYQVFLAWTPFVWGWLYNTQWFISLTLPWRTKVAAKNYQKTLSAIKEFGPDVIISTHTTASGIVSYLKDKKLCQGKFGIAFSDFHLHRFWLYGNADFYLANTEEQKEEMMELGVNANKIYICGMVLKPKQEVNVNSVKNKFEVKARQKVVLIASGSQGTGLGESLIAKFAAYPELKVIAVCGKNKPAFEKLSGRFAGFENVEILGFHFPMEELYAIADIFITKPGGLSVSEALRWRLPIIFSHLLPGGEQLNFDFLSEKILALPKSEDIESQVLAELKDSHFKKILATNPQIAKLLHNPEVVVEAVNASLNN